MRILLVADTAPPHMCGLSRKIQYLMEYLQDRKHRVELLGPYDFTHVRLYSFPVAFPNFSKVYSILKQREPDLVCILSEGPVGLSARICCWWQARKFCSMYCTRLPEYLGTYCRRYYVGNIIHYLTTKYITWFHGMSELVITPSQSMETYLKEKHRLERVKFIANGCDTEQFSPEGDFFDHQKESNQQISRPYWLFVGRISVEKNLVDFLELNELEGTKIVVGDGAELENYQKLYPDVNFLGFRQGKELASIYRSCDYFVFPSKTDTFGQVMVEAMASGLPVAAYPVAGPKDVILHQKTGILSSNLNQACEELVKLRKDRGHLTLRNNCVSHAKTFRWDRCFNEMENHFLSLNPEPNSDAMS